MPAEARVPAAGELPLFPLQAALFPGGLLNLKVFETRYLDLVTACLRDGAPFGVVALSVVAPGFEAAGTVAEPIDANSERVGILQLRCRGAQRFRVESSRRQADGLWLARIRLISDDDTLAPQASLLGTVRALASTVATLEATKNEAPFLKPYHFDDAGWVANRWCEILPISQAAKQRLMELTDPMVRLRLVDEFLRGKGLVT